MNGEQVREGDDESSTKPCMQARYTEMFELAAFVDEEA